MTRPVSQLMRTSQRGFVIVAVLWILVALSALVTIFSVYLSSSARALGVTDIGVESDALMSASLELAAYQLLSADEKSRPAQGSFRFRMDDADALVTYTSEAARVDLNHGSKEMLGGLFEVLGVDQKAAGELADRIVGWRTEPKSSAASNAASGAASNPASNSASTPPSNATGDEGALYLAAGRNYGPRGAPFAHVNELSLVLGATPAIVERVLPFVTVFSASADVDALLAPPEVIAALPGMTPAALNDFLKQRPSLPRDEKAIADALGPAGKDGAKLPDSTVFRVLTTLRFANGRRTSSEAVISLNKAQSKDAKAAKDDKDDKEPFRVLSWQDHVEPVARPLRQAGR